MEAYVSGLDGSFRVRLCGIQEKDRNVLKRILAITESRTRTYTLINGSSDVEADIIIVNADDRDAKAEWNNKYMGENGVSKLPTILASKTKLDNKRYITTTLPFFPTRVLKCLDEVTVKDLNFTPELRIDESEPESPESSGIRDYKTQLSNQELETFIGSRTDINAGFKKNSVLVVDDSLPVRKALDMKLRLMDYEVHHAANGDEALRMLRGMHPEFIFLDVVMPGIDGYEVCKQIKRNKVTKHIPVIMLTSRSSPFDKVKGKLAGCNNYLTKPVEHDEFEQVVAGIKN